MDPRTTKAALDATRKEVRRAEQYLDEKKRELERAGSDVRKAKREVSKAEKVVSRAKKEAIKLRGATYIDRHGNAVARTFTAAPAEPPRPEQLELSYDPEVALVSRTLDTQVTAYKRSTKRRKKAENEVKKARVQLTKAKAAVAEAEKRAEEALRAALGAEKLDAEKERDFGAALRSMVNSFTREDLSQLKLVFLDKSGSMGCSQNTYNALCLAACHSLAPAEGACMLFLLAGPGETQIFFSRAAQPARRINIKLGCCTWFNEPVFLTLKAIAPMIEGFRQPAAIQPAAAGDPAVDEGERLVPSSPSAVAAGGAQVPLQVVCITDGMDNCSSPLLAELPALADAVGAITDQAGRPIYLPLGSWKAAEQSEARQVLARGEVPVFLMWVAASGGSSHLLRQAVPGRLAVVDATFDHSEPDVLAQPDHDPAGARESPYEKLVVGAKVRVEGQAEGEDEAVVTALPEGGPEAQLLYLHNGSPACVPVASLSLLFGQYGEPPHKPKPSADGSAAPAAAAARTPNHQAVVHALALINASVTRTAELMSRVDCKSGICRQQEGAGFLGEGGDLSALRDTSRESRRATAVELIPEDPVPDGFLRELLIAVAESVQQPPQPQQEVSGGGIGSARLSAGLRTILERATTTLLQERKWDKEPLSSELESCGLALLCPTHGACRRQMLRSAVVAAMRYLESAQVVGECEIRLSGNTPIELRPEWDAKVVRKRIGYQMLSGGRLKLLAAVQALRALSPLQLTELCLQVHARHLQQLQKQQQPQAAGSQTAASA